MATQGPNNQAKPNTPPAQKERPPQTAVAPLDTLVAADAKVGIKKFDQWLRTISNGFITLDRIKTVLNMVPVVGNIFALIDLIGDILELVQNKAVDAFDKIMTWCSIAINAIGLIPGPGAAARTSLRPTLFLARQAKATGKNIVASLVAVIEAHITETLTGSIEKFISEAQAKLPKILDDATNVIVSGIRGVAAALRKATTPDFVASLNKAADELAAASKSLNNPKQAIKHIGWALFNYIKAEIKAVVKAVITLAPGIATGINNTAATLESYATKVKSEIDVHKTVKDTLTIMALLKAVSGAVAAYRKKHPSVSKVVPKDKGAEAKNTQPMKELGSTNHQSPGDSCVCEPKNVAPVKTTKSIHFSAGEEEVAHTDFIIDAPLPIVWQRTYRSNTRSFPETGPLGARWITPFTHYLSEEIIEPATKLKSAKKALIYYSPDGNRHVYPTLKVGEAHRDGIRQMDAMRLSDTLYCLNYANQAIELYERDPHSSKESPRYRLATLKAKEGQIIGLNYTETGLLHTLLLKESEKEDAQLLAHIRFDYAPDSTHISHIHLIDGDRIQRTLAHYTYSAEHDLIQAQDENNAEWHYQYDHHLLTRYTDRTNRGFNIVYNGTDLNAKAIREYADDGSFDTTLEWDKNIRLTYVTDALGQETWHYFDIKGFTYRIIHPDGQEEWFFRDKNANVTTHIHQNGLSDIYDYDERSNLLRHVRPDGSVTYFEYDDHDNLTSIRDGEAHVWKRDYNPQGQLIAEIDPRGNITEYAYNKAGLVTEIKDAKGNTKKITYTNQGQIASYVDCSDKTSQWTYDQFGRLTRFTNPAGESTQYQYAETGYLSKILHPDETAEYLEHDAEGRLLAHTDPLNRRTTYSYNAVGLIDKRRDAKGQTVDYVWDKLGRLVKLRNQNGATYQFQYDPIGQLTKEVGFDNKTTWYEYSDFDRALAKVCDGQNVTQLDFDGSGRLAERRAAKLAALKLDHLGRPNTTQLVPNTEVTETYAYNQNGALAYAKNAVSELHWFYDAAGNVEREHQHYHFEHVKKTAIWQHTYDELNQRIETIRPDGQRITLQTYGSGHVHGMLLNGETLADFERDDIHREISRSTNGFTRQTEYDPAGRIKSQLAVHVEQAGKTGTVSKRQYQYDRGGQLTHIIDQTRGTLEYRYDPIGQLIAANTRMGKEVFDFDPAGNLLDRQPTDYEASMAAHQPQRNHLLDNLLRNYAGTHYVYDKVGNVVQKNVGGLKESIERTQETPDAVYSQQVKRTMEIRFHGGTTTTYAWDSLNRMQSATTTAGTVHFYYDALGRRIGKVGRVHKVMGGWPAGPDYAKNQEEKNRQKHNYGTTIFGWDGDNLAWEWRDTPQNPGATHFIYEPNSFVPLAQIQQKTMHLHNTLDTNVALELALFEPPESERICHYHCDHLGTPQEISDENGDVLWLAHYKAWGSAFEVITHAAEKAGIKLHSPLRFQGQYFDVETGLHYNRFRYYDPFVGRFVSRDPIGLLGGMNVHAYAPNPIEWIDPLGLWGDNPKYKYRYNANGTLKSATAKIRPEDLGTGTGTNKSSRKYARKNGCPGDDAGHAIGNQLGGKGSKNNIIPQDPAINRGPFAQYENDIAEKVRNGNNVIVRVIPNYEGDSTRPVSITYQTRTNGVTRSELFEN